jgi:hypothetical protein
MPAQLMRGRSSVNARASGLPLVALRSLAMQGSIVAGGEWKNDLFTCPLHSSLQRTTRLRLCRAGSFRYIVPLSRTLNTEPLNTFSEAG